MSNNMKDLKDFFSTPEKPCGLTEMKEFWESLSDEEKEEFKNADLTS